MSIDPKFVELAADDFLETFSKILGNRKKICGLFNNLYSLYNNIT